MSRKLFEHRWVPLTLLLVLGLITRLAFISYPDEVVFDEVHFGKFVSSYFTNEYHFDVHPPLGKLLIAGVGSLLGFQAAFDFDTIGDAYGDTRYVALRFLPTVAGALIPAALYVFLLALGIQAPAAFLAAIFVLFDNAFLVQSRFILVDSLFLLFGFSGLWLLLETRRSKYGVPKFLRGAALLGLSVSVKWLGLSFLAFALALIAADHVRSVNTLHFHAWRRTIAKIAGLTVIPALIYLLVFGIHFSLLTKSGPGDPFMSPQFLRGIQGSDYAGRTELRPLNVFQKTWELNKAMFAAHQDLGATHPYQSAFYSWPLMRRSVSYWTEDSGADGVGYIYLLGNPVVWWLSTLGVAGGFCLYLRRWTFRRPWNRAQCWLYFGWIINVLPFAAVSRVLFLYHYLAAQAFAAAIVCALLFDPWEWSSNRQRMLWDLLVVAVLATFLFFLPLSFGWPLDADGYRRRMWLESWI